MEDEMQDENLDETSTDTEAEDTDTDATAGEAPKRTEPVEHLYYEVGNDLMAKPTALKALIYGFGLPATAVFCNSPSEADMVAVMLGKEGIQCEKLIGHVPHSKVVQTIQQAAKGEITAVVLTDVAAQDMEVTDFELVVNYAIHEDPEIYLHRCSGSEGAIGLKAVTSLVSPLDFGNFHYLKKIVDFDIAESDLPAADAMYEAQAKKLFTEALGADYSEDVKVQASLKALLENEDKDKIIAHLLHNTLNVIPSLASKGGGRGEGRDRDRRRGRRDDRDGDDRRGRDRNGSRERRERKPAPPKKKDVRYYIGHGASTGFTEEAFQALVKEHTEVSEEAIKRFSLRECYSFVDFPEEQSEAIESALEGATFGEDDSSLFFKKATEITVPREESEDNGEGEEAPEQQAEGAEEAGAAEEEASTEEQQPADC